MDLQLTWTIVGILGAVALLDLLLVNAGPLYRLADAVVFPWFPSFREAAARRHWRRKMKRSPRDAVAWEAVRRKCERVCLAVAEESFPAGEAAQWAAALGLASDAERIYLSAFEEALAAGDEARAMSLVADGKLSRRAAEHYEKRGDLRHAGEHFERARLPAEAARCFEAAGEPMRAVKALSEGGLRPELEALVARTPDPLARAAGKRILEGRS